MIGCYGTCFSYNFAEKLILKTPSLYFRTVLLCIPAEDNGIYGTIPSELAYLGSTLEEIDLSYNKLDFSFVPSELSSLTNLNALFLQGNYFEEANPKISDNDTNDSDKSKSSESKSSYKYTLNDVFCNIETEYVVYDNIISEFVADCNAKKGNVPCFCCTLCRDEHDICSTYDDENDHHHHDDHATKDFEMVTAN